MSIQPIALGLISTALLHPAPAPVGAPRTEDPIPALLAAVSAERIRDRVDTLAGFGTRHTYSRTDSDTWGIGAARRWIEADLRASSEATGGRLEVHVQPFTRSVRTSEGRREVEIVNVYGFLPGTHGDPLGRTYVVAGHYDSRASRGLDAESPAPGADDDASGTAVVLELARVLAAHEFEANLVFLCVAGEEQGLFGSSYFAEWAREQGLDVAAVMTNDIVGGVEGPDGSVDDRTIRCFAGGESPHAPSRELCRAVREAARRYVPSAELRMIFRLDRLGRGGDHIPFHEQGLPAVRFTEAREHYARQHQDVREEDGVQYGDLPEFVDEEYVARVARVNGAVLARLALAPPPPEGVRLRGAMRYDAELRWEAVRGAHGYEVVWRETTAAEWQHGASTEETALVLEGVVGDDHFFGVRAVGAGGHASLAAVPGR